MAARIYQRSKNAMQSGRARAGQWVLEFESGAAKRPDPLTGWSGGADTQEQVRLTFPTLEAAQGLCRPRNGGRLPRRAGRRAEAQAPGLRRQFQIDRPAGKQVRREPSSSSIDVDRAALGALRARRRPATSASGTRWTTISSPSTPPPSPTLVSPSARSRVKPSETCRARSRSGRDRPCARRDSRSPPRARGSRPISTASPSLSSPTRPAGSSRQSRRAARDIARRGGHGRRRRRGSPRR